MKRIFFLASIIITCTNASIAFTEAEEINGTVISVLDGNTIELVAHDNQTYIIFLVGIDSPELNQEFGDKAKKLLEKLTLGKKVIARLRGKDRKGNMLAEIIVDGRLDPRIELLKEGLAWTAEKNPLPDLEQYRIEAQERGKGLWRQNEPVAPWTFRRQQTMLQAKSS